MPLRVKMLYTLGDWNSFKQTSSLFGGCTQECFQIIDFGKEQKVVVVSGKFGYSAKRHSNDLNLKHIMAFCKDRGLLEIGCSTEAEMLFS